MSLDVLLLSGERVLVVVGTPWLDTNVNVVSAEAEMFRVAAVGGVCPLTGLDLYSESMLELGVRGRGVEVRSGRVLILLAAANEPNPLSLRPGARVGSLFENLSRRNSMVLAVGRTAGSISQQSLIVSVTNSYCYG